MTENLQHSADYERLAKGLADSLEELHYGQGGCPFCLPGSLCRAGRRLEEWYEVRRIDGEA